MSEWLVINEQKKGHERSSKANVKNDTSTSGGSGDGEHVKCDGISYSFDTAYAGSRSNG